MQTFVVGGAGSPRIRDPHAIRPYLLEADGSKRAVASGQIGEPLGSRRGSCAVTVPTDTSRRCRDACHDERASACLRERETDAGDVRHLVEERVVAPVHWGPHSRCVRRRCRRRGGSNRLAPSRTSTPRGRGSARRPRYAGQMTTSAAAGRAPRRYPTPSTRSPSPPALSRRGERDALVEVAELHAPAWSARDAAGDRPLDVRDPRPDAELRRELVELGGEPAGFSRRH